MHGPVRSPGGPVRRSHDLRASGGGLCPATGPPAVGPPTFLLISSCPRPPGPHVDLGCCPWLKRPSSRLRPFPERRTRAGTTADVRTCPCHPARHLHSAGPGLNS